MDKPLGINLDFHFGQVGKPPLFTEKVRLLLVNRKTGKFEHHHFEALTDILQGWQVWANDSIGSHPYFTQQNYYAKKPGSYLPPTAGIPFTPEMVQKLDWHTLTLHTADPRLGLKEEPYWFPDAPRKAAFAVGTTVAKGLESWGLTGDLSGSSDILIDVGWDWKAVGGLMTNFHWPNENLLKLTCAFGGVELIREAHKIAFQEKYLFSDYGDRLVII